ncbi:hypothetical protein [Glycomyces tarimensis]
MVTLPIGDEEPGRTPKQTVSGAQRFIIGEADEELNHFADEEVRVLLARYGVGHA